MKLDFYDVDKNYIHFLQNAEIAERGFTCVPNMEYGKNREQKFLCGIVLNINDLNYYVPVTSYKQKQSENILIVIGDDAYDQVKGSLRFNYMIPVPDSCIKLRKIKKEPNEARRIFLLKQLRYIQSISGRIEKKARRTYTKVTKGFDARLQQHACDFKFLEQKCVEYEKILSAGIQDDLEL